MTVGIVAACETDTMQSKVVFAADKMLTAQRASPIEYEHPGTKMTQVAPTADHLDVYLVYSGTVSHAKEFTDQLSATINNVRQETPNIGVRQIAKLADNTYSNFVQKRVQSVALDPLGLELSDLQRQHKFKDNFFDSVWGDVQSVRKDVYDNLNVLLGGVDSGGAHIYGVDKTGLRNLNDTGYAATGSGVQPAESEFIRNEYNTECPLEDSLSLVVAAKMRAEDAQGVGKETDIAVAGVPAERLGQNEIDFLRDREKEIQDLQEEAKKEVLADRTLDANLGGDDG